MTDAVVFGVRNAKLTPVFIAKRVHRLESSLVPAKFQQPYGIQDQAMTMPPNATTAPAAGSTTAPHAGARTPTSPAGLKVTNLATPPGPAGPIVLTGVHQCAIINAPPCVPMGRVLDGRGTSGKGVPSVIIRSAACGSVGRCGPRCQRCGSSFVVAEADAATPMQRLLPDSSFIGSEAKRGRTT